MQLRSESDLSSDDLSGLSQNIPIRILNTFNPTARGTYISKERVQDDSKAMIKGISSINDTCLITVQGLGMVGVIGVNYRIFKTLAKNGTACYGITGQLGNKSLTFAVQECRCRHGS